MPDVFLSYARRDSAEFVRRLNDALEADGIDVWVDLEDIPAASDWQRDLRDGVLQSDCFCFVVSPTSAASRYCLGELSDAEARNKRVIPLIHEPVAEADLPRLLQRLNWVPQRGTFEDDFDANVKVLVAAIRTDLEATRSHTRWEAAAAEWEEKGRDASLLPRGSELREAENWIATQVGRDPAPTALQAEFVKAARRAAERRRRMIFGATATALVVAIALGIVALLQRNEAREQRDNARSNELASASEANLDTDPELSIILGKEAVETVDTPRAEEALAKAISQSLVRLNLKDPGPKTIEGASFSPNDKLIVTAGGSGVRLWDSGTGEVVRELTPDPAFDADFTPDGSRIAVAGATGSLDIYATADGARQTSIATGSSKLYSVDVSPDGKLVAVAGLGGFAASFDLQTEHGVVFDGHDPQLAVNSVDYSPNSKVVLSAGNDGAARLWYADTAKELAVLKPSGDPVLPGLDLSVPGAPSSDAAFSPDGQSIATANNDGSVSLWSLDTAEPKATPITNAGDGFFSRVAFDQQRNAIIVSGIGRADSYDLETGNLVGTYRGHAGFVNQANVSSDGSQLVTAGQDGTARVWDFNQVRFSGRFPILVTDLGFDAAGKRIATSGFPAVIDVATASADPVPFTKQAAVAHIAFDPAEDRLALADTDGIVQFVDPGTGDASGPELDPPQDYVAQIAFSGDGSRLMVRVLRGGAYIYDTESGEQLGAVTPLTTAAAFSPDGLLVAHYGADTNGDLSVRVTDFESGDTVATLTGHTAPINSIAFGGDGSKIVTGSDDATARIWDTDTGEQLQRLPNQGQAVKSVAFSADGRYVATTGTGLAVFRAETGRELMRAPGFEDRVEFSPDDKLVAALGPGNKRVSVLDCDVCVDDVDSLLALADERITREPTGSERREYLDR